MSAQQKLEQPNQVQTPELPKSVQPKSEQPKSTQSKLVGM